MCLSRVLMFFKHFLTCIFLSGSLSSSHAKQVDKGRDHLLSHALPPSTQPFSSNTPPPLRGSSNTHHGKRTRKKIHAQIPEGHQCLVVDSSGTHSVGAPQTYSVKCSQGLKKVLGDEENVLSSTGVKKVVCNICYNHYGYRTVS